MEPCEGCIYNSYNYKVGFSDGYKEARERFFNGEKCSKGSMMEILDCTKSFENVFSSFPIISSCFNFIAKSIESACKD